MKTALLIDDAGLVRSVLAHILAPLGWQIFEAEDGDVGLELAARHRPDLVVCDLLMPRCNGFQVCRTIRKLPELRHTKIIVSSGSGYATDRLNALEAGAHAYLIKPVNVKEFLALVNRLTAEEPPQETAFFRARSGSDEPGCKVKFWGVRGSIPTPGPTTAFYGGNTSCVEVRADGEIIILDAGTGIRLLGLGLAKEFKGQPLSLTLLLTHTHWDHIQGFPFFPPAYNPKNQLRVLGFQGVRQGLNATLASQMESPYFPIGLSEMPGHIAIEDVKDMKFSIGAVQVQAHFMNHPGICVGYRLSTSCGSVAYLPDNEPFQRLKAPAPGDDQSAEKMEYARMQDKLLVQFIQDTDVLIMDSQYDAEEYPSHVGWGHGCVDDVVALAIEAGVKRLFLFHHDPAHGDEKISQMVAHARDIVTNQGSALSVEAAREGLECVLQPAAVTAHG